MARDWGEAEGGSEQVLVGVSLPGPAFPPASPSVLALPLGNALLPWFSSSAQTTPSTPAPSLAPPALSPFLEVTGPCLRLRLF